jgi:hypothetical protein
VTPASDVPGAARALLAGLVDYAGTFPPAALDLRTAVANYARYRASERSWMLGRLVIEDEQLEDFDEVARPLLPRGPVETPWRITVVIGRNLYGAVREVQRFNERHGRASAAGHAFVEFLEHRVARAADVRDLDEAVPVPIRSVFEVVPAADLEAVLKAVKSVEGMAKFRAGALTADAIPSVQDLARFIAACARLGVPMKMTAGLHRAIRGTHPFGPPADGAVALQHGFVNVLMAAALARDRAAAGLQPHDVLMLLQTVLDERDRAAFTFDAGGAAWRDSRVRSEAISSAREEFLTAIGSCSFDEPVADLQALGLNV